MTHDPAQPWCDICVRSKGRDLQHVSREPRVIPVIQFDYGEAGADGQTLEFMVGTDTESGALWSSDVIHKGPEDFYVNSIVS